MDKQLLRYTAEIKIVPSSIKKLNPQFSLCDILVCYHGDNRNMTSLSKKTIEENLYSIYGVPIVGEWIYKLDGTDEKTWGSHGGRIVIDDNGIHFEQTTRPFGFVTREAADNATWVTITEKNGHTQHEYLKLSGCILWTGRYKEAESILKQNYGQSMEIETIDGHYREDHCFDITKFVFSALCILGTDVDPCFESACIGRHYALDSFKDEFSHMMKEYAQFNHNIPAKGGINIMDLEKMNAFLASFTFKDNNGNDIERYTLLSSPTDGNFTIVDKEDNFKVYTVGFALDDNEDIVVDWDSKIEQKFELVKADAETALDLNTLLDVYAQSRADLITEKLTTFYTDKIDDLAQKCEELSAELEKSSNKLAEFEAQKQEADKAAHREEVDAIIKKFAQKMGKSAKFLIYRSKLDPDNVTIEDLTKDLTLMAGQELLKGHEISFSYIPQEVAVKKSNNDDISNRYGHLLDNFRK